MSRYDIPQFKDDTVYPLAHSEKGTNVYTHSCQITQHRAHYAACLAKRTEQKSTLQARAPECAQALNHGTCPALAMRREEEAKGVALFYIDRAKFNAFYQVDSADVSKPIEPWVPSVRSRPQPGTPVPRKTPAPVVPTPTPPAPAGNDYAAAINAALAATSSTPAPAPSKPAAPTIQAQSPVTVPAPEPFKPTAGMSPLEIARQMAARRTQ